MDSSTRPSRCAAASKAVAALGRVVRLSSRVPTRASATVGRMTRPRVASIARSNAKEPSSVTRAGAASRRVSEAKWASFSL